MYWMWCTYSQKIKTPGYVPEHNMFREDVICRRCFRLKNYNEVQDVGMESEDFLNLLTGLSEKRNYCQCSRCV